jgi:hypothetical protein
MAEWDAPDKYEGKLVPPGSPAWVQLSRSFPEESSAFDNIAAAIEALYAHEPKLTRNLLEQLRAASTSDLERLFGS